MGVWYLEFDNFSFKAQTNESLTINKISRGMILNNGEFIQTKECLMAQNSQNESSNLFLSDVDDVV